MGRTRWILVFLGLAAFALTGYVLGRVHQAHLATQAADYKQTTYAQQAEDLIVANIFSSLGIDEVRYLDIGAADPVQDSNTYLFYRRGHRGVLVEPNPMYGPRYKEVRPGDKWLEAGVGLTDEKEADYYMIADVPGWNTFSRAVADKHAAKGYEVTRTKRPLVNINKVIAENFKAPPNFISIDIEGLDLEVIRTLDFEKYRPAVICIETLMVGTHKIDPRIEEFLRSKKYTVRGATFVNTIFLANELVKK